MPAIRRLDLARVPCVSDPGRTADRGLFQSSRASGQEPRIDVLINNAGALFATRQVTEDGLEYTFALNHLAYFVVTEGLRDRLVGSAPARIVNTASAAHHGAILDFDDLQSEKGFSATKAYNRSKLCNILFTRELASRLHRTGVTANCLHPSFVATRFGDQSGGLISRFVWVAKFFAISPEEGAKTSASLAKPRNDEFSLDTYAGALSGAQRHAVLTSASPKGAYFAAVWGSIPSCLATSGHRINCSLTRTDDFRFSLIRATPEQD